MATNTAASFTNHTGNNTAGPFSISFSYLSEDEIDVTVGGVLKSKTTHYTFPSATTISFTSGNHPGNGVAIKFQRDTDISAKKVDFQDGSVLTETDLDNNSDQVLFGLQEFVDILNNDTVKRDGSATVTGNLVFEGATDDAHETTLAITDPTADRTITLPDSSGTVLTTGSTGAVTKAMLAADSVDSSKIEAGSIVDSDINASAAIAGSKITAATTSAAGTLSAADKTKLDGIETSATADQTAAEIRTLVESATDSNVFTDADHTKLDGIETAATADQTAAEIKTLIASSPLDASHLAANSVTTSELADNELSTLAGMQSGTASLLASSTALTSTTTELNQLDGKTLGETSLTTNSDTAIPTSKAVNDRIIAVTNALGGFVAITNETSFPGTHPDPSEGAGTVVSVSDAGGVVINGSGVASIANGAGSGNTVTINGFPSSLYSKTLGAGIGLQVQTTSTLHTYDYHKILAKEADVEQLSGDINDFNERYRIASSAPGSNNDNGDLYFDTSTNKMMVYDGSAWGEVASTGSFYINTLASSGSNSDTPPGGSATFNGTAKKFTLSNPPTTAQQLLVSVGGVIQKPNPGTGVPSEGFAINGNDIIFSTAPASGADFFIVTIGASVSVGTPSNNTVTEAILQTNAVSEEKLKISNSGTNGQFLQKQSGNTGGLTWADVNTSTIPVANEGTDTECFPVFTTAATGDQAPKTNTGLIYNSNTGYFKAASYGSTTQSGNGFTWMGPGSTSSGTNAGYLDHNGILLSGTSAGACSLRFCGNTESVYVGFKSAGSGLTSGTVLWTLPTADGSAGQALTTNGSTTLSWSDVSSTSGDGTMYKNTLTISNNVTIAATEGAHSVGPITNNATVTVNGRWVIS